MRREISETEDAKGRKRERERKRGQKEIALHLNKLVVMPSFISVYFHQVGAEL